MQPGVQSRVTSRKIRGLQNDNTVGFYLRIRLFFLVLITVPLFQTQIHSHDNPYQVTYLKS